MPIVRVELLKGRTAEQKRQLIAALTSAVHEALGVEDERIQVVIAEIEPDSWGRGGVPLGERAAVADGARG